MLLQAPRSRRSFLALGLAVLAGCQSAPQTPAPRAPAPRGGPAAEPVPPPATVPVPAAPPVPEPTAPPAVAALGTEHRWLQAWFKDTPVTIQLGAERLSLEVPSAYCFDAARSTVKPPLAAVLDKVAESLRRQPQLRLALLGAPADAGVADLVQQRGAQVRQHLRGRGVADARLAQPSRSGGDGVVLVLQPAQR